MIFSFFNTISSTVISNTVEITLACEVPWGLAGEPKKKLLNEGSAATASTDFIFSDFQCQKLPLKSPH